MQTNYRSFRDIPIPNDRPVSVFASGPSVGNISTEEIQSICKNSFSISINYGILRIPSHLNVWSDQHVTEFMNEHLMTNPKTCEFLVRIMPYEAEKSPEIDYKFCPLTENLKGCFTLVWLLQLLNRHFPQQKILLFGLDLQFKEEKEIKWYDAFSDWDVKHRRSLNLIHKQMELCRLQLEEFVVGKGHILNCNLDSGFHSFPKIDYRKELGL